LTRLSNSHYYNLFEVVHLYLSCHQPPIFGTPELTHPTDTLNNKAAGREVTIWIHLLHTGPNRRSNK